MNQKFILENKIKQAIKEFEEATGTDIVGLNLEVTSREIHTINGLFLQKQITLDIKL